VNSAFGDICAALGLTATSDQATEVVARRLIGFARAGKRDAGRLRTAVLDSLRAG
jgi:hypothetical protein